MRLWLGPPPGVPSGEGAELYKLAEEQFDSVNNLERKIMALKKSARNIERLMEMK